MSELKVVIEGESEECYSFLPLLQHQAVLDPFSSPPLLSVAAITQ